MKEIQPISPTYLAEIKGKEYDMFLHHHKKWKKYMAEKIVSNLDF